MTRKALVLVPLVAVSALIATAASGQRTAAPRLNGTVGPDYTITLKQNSKVVKTLKAGSYKLVIADKAQTHAFSLDGPHGYAKYFTKVPFVGTKTLIVTLRAGGYKYYCPPHEPFMFGRFKVT